MYANVTLRIINIKLQKDNLTLFKSCFYRSLWKKSTTLDRDMLRSLAVRVWLVSFEKWYINFIIFLRLNRTFSKKLPDLIDLKVRQHGQRQEYPSKHWRTTNAIWIWQLLHRILLLSNLLSTRHLIISSLLSTLCKLVSVICDTIYK